MSNDNHKPEWLSTPTESEIEALLSEIKPRPTARLTQLMRSAPWRAEEQGTNMTQLRRLNFIGTAAAILLLVVVAVVVINRWPFGGDENFGAAPLPTRLTSTPETVVPTATLPPPTPVIREQPLAILTAEAAGDEALAGPAGIALGNGRLFKTEGPLGIRVFDVAAGEELAPIVVLDPDTGQPVSVRDLAWGPFLWLAPPDIGLIVLTDPFEDGNYLHLINPENGEIVRSMQINSNIAIDNSQPLLSESVPNHLVMTDSGELYLDRVYTFAPEKEGDPPVAYHYILRTMLEGRILNSMLVRQGPVDEAQPDVIEALAYQAASSQVFAAVRLETGVAVQKFSLINQPGLTAAFDGEDFGWDNYVSMSSDDQGHVYFFLDGPDRIMELDENDSVVGVYGFGEAVEGDTAVDRLFAEPVSQPATLIVSPDGTQVYVVDQNQGQLRIVIYPLWN